MGRVNAREVAGLARFSALQMSLVKRGLLLALRAEQRSSGRADPHPPLGNQKSAIEKRLNSHKTFYWADDFRTFQKKGRLDTFSFEATLQWQSNGVEGGAKYARRTEWILDAVTSISE